MVRTGRQLQRRITEKAHCKRSAPCFLAERKGLEPSASGVTGRRYNRLNYRSGWWAVQDLNLWPPPCKGGAQPTELTAHDLRTLTRYVRQRQAAERGSGSIPVFFSVAGRRLLPGIRAGSRAQRVAGGRGLRSPSPPTTPNPALGLPSLTDNADTRGVPLASFLPRGSGRSASRCPALTRDERPSGVGASAPFGAAISSAPCRAYVSKRNRCSRSASGMSSL